MAERTGLEPATPGVTGRYSNQLNYRSGFGGANPNGLINKATSSFAPAAAGDAVLRQPAARGPRGTCTQHGGIRQAGSGPSGGPERLAIRDSS